MKKSERISSIDVNEMLAEYKDFLYFLKKEIGIKNISKTKLQKFVNIADRSDLDFQEICELCANINRFRRIRSTLELKKDSLNAITLEKLLSGSETSKFYSDASEDAFFEIDIAQRLINQPYYKSIDLNTDADIILNNHVAIECKKIHGSSANSLKNNIEKANSQINTRIKDNLCAHGFIAVELTSQLDHSVIQQKSQEIFDLFLFEYTKLDLPDTDIAGIVVNDKNFQKTIQGVSGGLLELCFESKYRRCRKNPLGRNVMGVFYQAESYIPLACKENSTAIFQRLACYKINTDFADCRNGRETIEQVKYVFHSLCTGV